MRHIIWILSFIAPIITLFLGTFFNFLGSFGFDYRIAYDDPYNIIVTSIGLLPGVTLALIGLGMGIFDASRNHQGLWLWGQAAWPLIIILFDILFFQNAILGQFWWTPLITLSLPALLYGSPASQQTAPTPRKGYRFVAILSAVVLAGIMIMLLSPTFQYSPPPSMLAANAAGTNADCAHATYPLITLQNMSGAAVTWKAKSLTYDNAPLSLTPASGSLAAHGTVEVRVSGKTTGAVVSIQFDDLSGASPALVKLLCGPGK
ncbi:MAG TPA: hypothetical protein VFN35_06745 [Ktedonobacteraceae bacterium]|nr:hypothetical protein [Ktedonobacteraceae bacterium]